MGRPLSPQNLPLPMGGFGPPSNTWFTGPTQVLNPNGSSIGAAVFAGLTSVRDRSTDRQTDRPRYSVGKNQPHLRTYSTAMRPKNRTDIGYFKIPIPIPMSVFTIPKIPNTDDKIPNRFGIFGICLHVVLRHL